MGTINEGAHNAIATCMAVKNGERVLIVTDEKTFEVGQALKEESEKFTAPRNVQMVLIEDYEARPLKSLPHQIEDLIPWANVTFWCAESLAGELPARQQFMSKAKQYARHGHMPNVTRQLMEQGMCADYNEVYRLTHKIFEIVNNSSEIRVKNQAGTDLTLEFNKDWKWVASDGRYHDKGRWGNLPEGEVFTAPFNVNGTLTTNLLGDWFSAKYGNFKETLGFRVTDSRIDLRSITTGNAGLLKEISDYLLASENSNRASEFALPTNPLLMSLPTIGNLLQDEKARVHIAFGDPYSHETRAPWNCSTHVDMILDACDVWVDARQIMKAGSYIV